jgi:hypothetical protein
METISQKFPSIPNRRGALFHKCHCSKSL